MSTPPPPPSDRLTDYFNYLAMVSPAALKVWGATGEAEFASAVGEALDQAMKALQADAALSGRELLSRRVVHHLSAAAVPCGAEEGHDGHVTVTVKHPAELAYTVRRSLGPR
jgi:hypothetical protein